MAFNKPIEQMTTDELWQKSAPVDSGDPNSVREAKMFENEARDRLGLNDLNDN